MMRSINKKSFLELAIRLVVIGLFLSAVGCASTPAKNRVPSELTSQVGIKGVPNARFWADEWPHGLLERLKTYTVDDLRKHASGTYEKAHHYLAISGGGAKGAFGAGLLAGWTASGTRPEFAARETPAFPSPPATTPEHPSTWPTSWPASSSSWSPPT